MSKFTKKCLAIRTLPEQSVRMAMHFFVNFDVFKSLYLRPSLINTKLRDFVNLGVVLTTMWINSCSSPNLQTRTQPFRFEIRQC